VGVWFACAVTVPNQLASIVISLIINCIQIDFLLAAVFVCALPANGNGSCYLRGVVQDPAGQARGAAAQHLLQPGAAPVHKRRARPAQGHHLRRQGQGVEVDCGTYCQLFFFYCFRCFFFVSSIVITLFKLNDLFPFSSFSSPVHLACRVDCIVLCCIALYFAATVGPHRRVGPRHDGGRADRHAGRGVRSGALDALLGGHHPLLGLHGPKENEGAHWLFSRVCRLID
jgi:hypothetical protein